MSTPPAKRRRTEDASITRSDIWYADGSVVLQSQNTQFRVHWSILGQQSSFFRDMHGLPQPPDQPSVDGCPVVELQDDAADIEHLMTSLYSPTFLTRKMLPFPVVAALIRLGRKYDFREVLNKTVERITYENPTTLEKYDALKRNDTRTIGYYDGIFFDMLTLARENNILAALPCAYYRILRKHDHSQMFDGITRIDGTKASLAPIDLRTCVMGHQRLVRAQWAAGNTLECLKVQDYDECIAPTECNAYRQVIVVERGLISGYFGALLPLSAVEAGAKGRLCAPCLQNTMESMAAGRKKMWDDLPGFFDLPPWSELKNDL
ncbi:hypothetical protein B0H11DRAFT_612659 [Mycena galericulata]|nr:hypothetical protein B0H11DRAFT_612659 [Mycena galericulata]